MTRRINLGYYIFGDWWELTGGFTEVIPGDLCTFHLDVGSTLYREDETSNFSAILTALTDYLDQDPDHIHMIEKIEGYGARLSAPGYTDCTEWTVFDTEAEAKAYLEEQYDVEFDNDE